MGDGRGAGGRGRERERERETARTKEKWVQGKTKKRKLVEDPGLRTRRAT